VLTSLDPGTDARHANKFQVTFEMRRTPGSYTQAKKHPLESE
jgi:hypothetical protein